MTAEPWLDGVRADPDSHASSAMPRSVIETPPRRSSPRGATDSLACGA